MDHSVLDGASHYGIKFVLRNQTVSVQISTGNQFLQLFLRNVLRQFLGNSAQVLD